MTKKNSSAFMSKLAMGVIFAIIVVYTFYHMISLFSNNDVTTIVSGVTTQSQTVEGKGLIFRDETLLSSKYSGAIDYNVADGEKVSNGQKLADVYASDGTDVRPYIFAIDKQIAVLKKSTIGAEPLDLTELRKDANNTYYSLVALLNSGSVGELSTKVEAMMTVLNKISLLTDDATTVARTLAEVERLRESFFEGGFVTEKASEGGYFYYSADGYEEFFRLEAAEALTEESFYALANGYESAEPRIDKNVYGKFAPSTKWCLALPIDADDAATLNESDSYAVNFIENGNTTLTMTLEKKIDARSHGEVICLLSCNKLPSGFSFGRVQNVELALSTVSGIYVPRSALTNVDGIRGVYVLRGSIVRFRKVDIIYESFDYCLVSPAATEEGGYYSLGNNELIITNGKNLFDGRILDK